MTDLHRCIASNLKQRRSLVDLTQAQLAEKSDISVGFIGEIEVGRKYPSLEMLGRLASALQVKPWQLLMEPAEQAAYQEYLDTVDLYARFADKMTEKLDAYLANRPRSG